MKFSIKEMSDALTRIGYKVVEEKEVYRFSTYNDQTEEEEADVINCYLHGDKMSAWCGLGSRRLEYTFQQELNKKLLNLFQGIS